MESNEESDTEAETEDLSECSDMDLEITRAD